MKGTAAPRSLFYRIRVYPASVPSPLCLFHPNYHILMLPQAFPQNYPGKTNTQLLLCAWESLPTQGSVCAAFVCSGMSRAAGFQAQGKTLPASKVPSQAFPPAFPKAVGLRGVCVDGQMSAQLGCSGHGRRDTTEVLPCCSWAQLAGSDGALCVPVL